MRQSLLLGLGLCLAASVIEGPAFAQKKAPAAKYPVAAPTGSPVAGDPQLAKLEATALKMEKQAKARPKDAKLKVKVADAFYGAGTYAMNKSPLPPRVKYRTALKHFRTALAYNPKHDKAAAEKKMIEDIYRSMGRPVPQ